MSVNEPGSISIPIEPDGSGFAIDLNKILTKASEKAKVEVQVTVDKSDITKVKNTIDKGLGTVDVKVKPDVSGLASELKKASKSTEANLSIGIKAEFTKSSLADLKTSVKAQFDGFSTKVGSQTYTIKPNIELDVRFTESSLKKLKTSINNTFKTVERDAEGKATKITSPIDLTAEFTQKSLNKLKADVSNTFKRTVEKDGGKTTKVVSPINLQAKFTQGSLAQLKRDVSNTFKKTITNADGSTTKVAIPIKITPELSKFSKENIALVKAKLLQDFGVVKLPVVAVQGVNKVGSITNIVDPGAGANLDKVSQKTRNLGRDLTVLGRVATESKSSIFSFSGSISPAQVLLTAFGTGLVQASKSFIRFGIESSKGIQQTDLALHSFLNNNQAATTAFIKQMQNFAAVTPFNLESVLKTSKSLLGAGQNVTKILPELKAIGGIGAQLGVSSDAIGRVGTAIAKIAGQGKVTSRELRTIFTAFPGFQPIKALADNLEGFGGSTSKVLKAMSKGAVDANSAIDALIKGMLQFPGAASALYKQSLLLAGSQETLKDRFEQVARSATGGALQQLALDYREAAEVFNQQSKTGLGGGIRSLIRDGGDLIPVLARGVVPVIDQFAGAIAEFLPPLKTLVSEMGGPLFETFTAFLRLAPAAASGLSLFANVVTPLAPVITTFAKALQLIPTPIIALAGALKLIGSTGGVAAVLSGKSGGKIGGFVSKLNPINMIKDVDTGLTKVGGTFSKIGSNAKSFFNLAGLTQYTKKIDSLNEKLVKVGNATAIGGRGGFFSGIIPAVSKVSLINDELDKVEKKGVTVTQKIGGSLSGLASGLAGGIKSAGEGILSAFGGPAGIAITAATVGAGALFEKYQKTKAEAEQVRKETTLIGKELSLDSSASNGADRLVQIVHKLATETEIAAKNIAKLEKGFKGIDTSKLGGDVKDTLTGLQGGLSENQLSAFLANKKKFDAATKELQSQAGDLRGSGGFLNINSAAAGFNRLTNDTFVGSLLGVDGNSDSEKALSASKKVYDEYVKSAKSSVAEELSVAKQLDKHGLVSVFEQGRVDLENGKDPSKVYENIRGSITKLSIAQASLDDSALKAALSGSGLTDSMKKSTSATTAYNDATDELNTSLNELILNQDNISAATVTKATDPKVLGRLSSQFASLAADPEAQTQFLKDITAQVLQVTNDPTATNAIVAQITGWKEAAASALADFKKSFTDSLPQLSTIFGASFDLDKGPSLADIGSRFVKSSDTILQYTKNLAKLQGTKYAELAGIFASQGLAGANAAADAVASLNKSGTSKTLDELQKRIGVYNAAIKDAGTSITDTAKTYVGGELGISPNIIVDPSLTIKDPTQQDIDAAAARLEEISTGIQKRRDELNRLNKNLKQHGEKPVSTDLSKDPLYAGVLEEQARLQTFLDGAKKQIFTDLQTQAGSTAAAINTTFAGAKIDQAVQPQIDNIVTQVTAVPAKINTALNDDPFAYIGTGIQIGTQVAQGVGIGFSQTLPTISAVLKGSFTTLGTEMAAALSVSFTAGLKNLPNAILDPFRTTSIPLNTYLATLNTMGKALGLGDNLFPQKFHTGGIVGEKSESHSGRFTSDEQVAVLKKGEGVLPKSVMMKMGKGSFEMLRQGKIGDGLGKSNEERDYYNAPKDIASINAAKDLYLRQYSSGVIIRNMADAVVTRFAEASIQYVQKATAALFAGSGVTGVIASGAVVDSLLAAKGKPGSYKTLIQAMNGSGLPFGVSSTVRPGAITASGNSSLHSVARAVDFVGTAPQMLQMAKWWTQYAPYLAELIHTPLGYGIKNGKRSQYPLNVLAGHYNHGHVALHSGGFVKGTTNGIIANIGERGQSEIVLPLSQPERMAKLISYAARNGSLGQQGQEAIANALNISGGTSNSNNNNTTVGEIVVKVESGAKDPALRGHIAASQILSTLRGL